MEPIRRGIEGFLRGRYGFEGGMHRLNSPLYDERVWAWAFGGGDPFGELSQIGAQIGPQRAIRTLYRIRYSFLTPGADTKMSTVGYPIFVAAA